MPRRRLKNSTLSADVLINAPRFIPMPIQHARHTNLRAVLAQLDREGIAGYGEQAEHLGSVTPQQLAAMACGAPIEASFSNHVEWALHRRHGWMDELHENDPLEA
jgi:hypothetical protein